MTDHVPVPAVSAREQTAEWAQTLRDRIDHSVMRIGGLPLRADCHAALAALLAEVEQLREEVQSAETENERILGLADEHLIRIEAIRDGIDNDEWKKHMIDGIAHYNATFCREFLKWKQRARKAEAVVEQQTAALRKIADFKPRLRQTNVLEYVQTIALAALRAAAGPGTDG